MLYVCMYLCVCVCVCVCTYVCVRVCINVRQQPLQSPNRHTLSRRQCYGDLGYFFNFFLVTKTHTHKVRVCIYRCIFLFMSDDVICPLKVGGVSTHTQTVTHTHTHTNTHTHTHTHNSFFFQIIKQILKFA
jgi:hypothetical protein